MSRAWWDNCIAATHHEGWEKRLFDKIARPKPKVELSKLKHLESRSKVWIPEEVGTSKLDRLDGLATALEDLPGVATWGGISRMPPSPIFTMSPVFPYLFCSQNNYIPDFSMWLQDNPEALESFLEKSKQLAEARKVEREKKESAKQRFMSLENVVAVKPPPPKLDQKSPDEVECRVGWRMWNVDLDSSLLESTGTRYSWIPRHVVPAQCSENNCYPCPTEDCKCGYYSYSSLEHLIQQWDERLNNQYMVAGSIYVWGTVIETTHGYRSQYAYPKELWCLHKEHAKLGEVYNIPVRVLQESLALRSAATAQ